MEYPARKSNEVFIKLYIKSIKYTKTTLFEIVSFFVFRKPLARLVVPKSLSEEADKKTPFAIIRLRSANCNRKQKEDIQDGTE